MTHGYPKRDSTSLLPASGSTNVAAKSDDSGVALQERAFNIPLRDGHGHSERISLRVHPAYFPVLNKILASKAFPLRSTNDIVRYGIDRACRELGEAGDIPHLMRHIDAIREVLAFEEQQLDFLQIFDTAMRSAQTLISTGAAEEAARMMAKMRHEILAMPEGYWRGRYEQELLTRFGHLLRVTPGDGAGLHDGD